MKIDPSYVALGGLVGFSLIALLGVFMPRWISSESHQLLLFELLAVVVSVTLVAAIVVHYYIKWSGPKK